MLSDWYVKIVVFEEDAEKFGCPHCGGPLSKTTGGGARMFSKNGSLLEQTCTSDVCVRKTFRVVHFFKHGEEDESATRANPVLYDVTFPHPLAKKEENK